MPRMVMSLKNNCPIEQRQDSGNLVFSGVEPGVFMEFNVTSPVRFPLVIQIHNQVQASVVGGQGAGGATTPGATPTPRATPKAKLTLLDAGEVGFFTVFLLSFLLHSVVSSSKARGGFNR